MNDWEGARDLALKFDSSSQGLLGREKVGKNQTISVMDYLGQIY